jgi:hypothetical protein
MSHELLQKASTRRSSATGRKTNPRRGTIVLKLSFLNKSACVLFCGIQQKAKAEI